MARVTASMLPMGLHHHVLPTLGLLAVLRHAYGLQDASARNGRAGAAPDAFDLAVNVHLFGLPAVTVQRLTPDDDRYIHRGQFQVGDVVSVSRVGRSAFRDAAQLPFRNSGSQPEGPADRLGLMQNSEGSLKLIDLRGMNLSADGDGLLFKTGGLAFGEFRNIQRVAHVADHFAVLSVPISDCDLVIAARRQLLKQDFRALVRTFHPMNAGVHAGPGSESRPTGAESHAVAQFRQRLL